MDETGLKYLENAIYVSAKDNAALDVRNGNEPPGGSPDESALSVLDDIYEGINLCAKVFGFSGEVDDAVYGSLKLANGMKGQISVNWSDDTVRKMTTSMKVHGDGGKLEADATTLKIYVKEDKPKYGLQKGWNFKYITDVTPQVSFNLRGEEYTAESEAFINSILTGKVDDRNSFESALQTDYIIKKMEADSEKS